MENVTDPEMIYLFPTSLRKNITVSVAAIYLILTVKMYQR